jgi:hypothetical protein
MAALVATVVARAATRTAIESRATRRTATTIGTAATAIWPAAATVAAAVTAAAAERPLESRARIAADPSGVAREVFARGRRAAGTRGAGFARKEDDVLFEEARFGDCVSGGCREHFGFDADMFGFERFFVAVIVDVVFLRIVFVRFLDVGIVFGVFVLGLVMFAMLDGVFSTFLG